MFNKPDVDFDHLRQALSQPQGYRDPKVQGIFEKFFWTYTDDKARDSRYRQTRESIINFVGDLLWSGKVSLATGSDTQFLDDDHERAVYGRRFPITQVIIHHSATRPNVTIKALNAHGFLEKGLYADHFSRTDRHGRDIFSGHRSTLAGAPNTDVFFTYHHVVKPDGKVVQLLTDSEIGWHAGDWDTNLLSVGICFLGDFSRGKPTDKAIKAANTLIESRYPGATVKGHREVVTTVCPGNQFEKGWKNKLKGT